ncbi:MAG: Eco57I restriction-modification methylase domain-containing protein [Alphaproteobacteria bacterium]|nr:Eco57I restriction-modification methylase domain-containing protein [Alphaproteobacteria bacterium]
MTDAEFVSSIQPTTDFVGENIDVLEEDIYALSPYLLRILLQDKSTGHFIRWGCDNYKKYGDEYTAEKEIFPRLIIGRNTTIIQPRIAKSKSEQKSRTRESAEVFTPSWICNEMNNACDEEYFSRTNVFNVVQEKDWMPVTEPIEFKENKNKDLTAWKKYVDSRRLEITCGEAPYLVSRYDTTTGEFLPLEKRIGLLDRKLRIVHENTMTETEWFVWAKRAFESIYGYEFQGDNLLLARENLLLTFIDYFKFKFRKAPELSQLKIIANVIAWNIWQMDGLTDTAPYSVNEQSPEIDLFEKKEIVQEKNKDRQGRKNPVVDLSKVSPVLCQIRNWRSGRSFYFKDLKGEKTMKFDVVIGNPPYQVSDGGHGSSSKPVYDDFFDASVSLNPEYISMIMPSRWMTGGKGLDNFRNRMINDRRLKLLHDYMNSADCFKSVSIEGGVCFFIWDKNNTQKCRIFTHTSEGEVVFSERYLSDGDMDVVIREVKSLSIIEKVKKHEFNPFSDCVLPRNPFGIENIDSYITNKEEKIKILGRFGNEREKKFVSNKYTINKNENIVEKWKVFISKADGAAGQLGNPIPARILGKAELGEPNVICTETFLAIAPFASELEAKNVIFYMKTKFLRFMVGIRKLKNMTRETYSFVPLQDFTENSDIDWSKSIPEIDQQLYKKYDLSDEEIAFIEKMIKPME